MSESTISRKARDFDITLHTATSLATTLDLRDVAGAVVSFGTMSTNAATIQVWGANSESGAYRRVYGSDGSAADITLTPSSTEGRIYSLPDATFALPFAKLVSGSTNSTGTSGIVMLKS